MTKRIRKINGKNFNLQDETFLKSDADRTAKTYRKSGHLVRVVKTAGGRAVYVR